MPLKRKDSDHQDISSVKGKGRDDSLSGLYVKSFHIYHQFKHHSFAVHLQTKHERLGEVK